MAGGRCTSATVTIAWIRFAFLLFVVFPTQAAKLAVQLAAAFEPDTHPTYSRILQKAVNDVNNDPRFDFTLVGFPLTVNETPRDTMSHLCRQIDQHNLTGLVALVEHSNTFAAAMVGGASGLPIIGSTAGFEDHSFKDVSPYYQGLNPSLEHAAEAITKLLQVNHWYTSIFLSDDSVMSEQLRRKLDALTTQHPWTRVGSLTVPRRADRATLFRVLSEAAKFRSRVIVLHCEAQQAAVLFDEANRLNMLDGGWIWLLVQGAMPEDPADSAAASIPPGVLGIRVRDLVVTKHVVRASIRIFATALRNAGIGLLRGVSSLADGFSCWFPPSEKLTHFSISLHREMQRLTGEIVSGRQTFDGGGEKIEGVLTATFDIVNLREDDAGRRHWRPVGNVTGGRVYFDAVLWPGNLVAGPHPTANTLLRVVTAFSPPFVIETSMLPNRTCLKGVPCLLVKTNKSDVLAAIAAQYLAGRGRGISYNLTCCCGFSIDLLVNIGKELQFDFVLYVVADGRFGARRFGSWNGLVADLISGAAHLAFAPFSVTSNRAEYVDFSVPYFYSGISSLTSTKYRDVPLLAFLAPFSPYLWIAIFASLHATAIAAALYEWLSPFGLNPWGRQRTKNFSMASALWVMWSLLFSHLVAFKAPKSWPNKVLINLWGCFSVIFLASYTANIAALFAGLFFQPTVNTLDDQMLLSHKIGTVRSSSSEIYVNKRNPKLWKHMIKYGVDDMEEGVAKLRDGELDFLVGDTAILDYYKATDPGCSLKALGETINEDSYAVGLPKGSPLKDPITTLIAKYNENGYLDFLTGKWYNSLPCVPYRTDAYKPMPLSIGAVAGVFIMLLVGMVIGCLILILEHLVFRHALPKLRATEKGTIWRSPNLMFLSQKLYRFINCVEPLSPHHSAKEMIQSLRDGNVFELFQKSVKKKENEQRRRRKSKAQFFEVFQQVRRVQKESISSGCTKDLLEYPAVEAREENETEEKVALKEEESIGSNRASYRKRISAEKQANNPAYFSDDSCSNLIGRAPSPLGGVDYLEDDDENSDCDGEILPARFSPISTSLNELSPFGACDEPPEGWRDPGPSCSGSGCPPPGRCRASRVRSFDDLKLLTGSLMPITQGSAPYLQQCEGACGGYEGLRNHFLRGGGGPSFSCKDIESAFAPPLALGERRLQRLTKDDIVLLWQSSERHLRRRLRQVLQEKAELEVRLATFQRALLQPP